ncbi:toll/interleukin-1 receptor domain-containing protein [Actinokineospora auranticolor]|uniref:TIR domain-containing protein n=1 Tax=Actinokineospora auranticolor TaxID=155976 RepID=A0A2S6GI44_9PSEU|nr:toll/interleukin-1 receptor domain-containing protein [Actinokineospora auranticolor]PPK64831.1 TIR domain-containing protein [Actinokineospora auranticolor]
MSGYQFDVFISYSRKGTAQRWLLNHFYERLVDCLADQIAPAPAVYIDRSMSRGVHWPSNLRQALQRSKIIVPIYTPPYFQSPWCMAEWRSMRERERVLGLASADVPQGLILPILFSDSDNFPMEARDRSWVDFKAVANPDPSYQTSRGFADFHQMVVGFATELAKLLPQVPEWQPDWPLVVEPDPVLIPPPMIPRFERL